MHSFVVPNFSQFIVLHPKLQKKMIFLEKSSFVNFCPLHSPNFLQNFRKITCAVSEQNIIISNFGQFMVLHAKLQKKNWFFSKNPAVSVFAPCIALTSYQISEKSRVPFPSKMWTHGRTHARTDGPESIGPPVFNRGPKTFSIII